MKLQNRIAGLKSAMPRDGKPSMAERAVLRWADVPDADRSRHMADLARRRWAVRDA